MDSAACVHGATMITWLGGEDWTLHPIIRGFGREMRVDVFMIDQESIDVKPFRLVRCGRSTDLSVGSEYEMFVMS